jgi:hypothetical protein
MGIWAGDFSQVCRPPSRACIFPFRHERRIGSRKSQKVVGTVNVVVPKKPGLICQRLDDAPLEGDRRIQNVLHSPSRSSRIAGTPMSRTPCFWRISSLMRSISSQAFFMISRARPLDMAIRAVSSIWTISSGDKVLFSMNSFWPKGATNSTRLFQLHKWHSRERPAHRVVTCLLHSSLPPLSTGSPREQAASFRI